MLTKVFPELRRHDRLGYVYDSLKYRLFKECFCTVVMEAECSDLGIRNIVAAQFMV